MRSQNFGNIHKLLSTIKSIIWLLNSQGLYKRLEQSNVCIEAIDLVKIRMHILQLFNQRILSPVQNWYVQVILANSVKP